MRKHKGSNSSMVSNIWNPLQRKSGILPDTTTPPSTDLCSRVKGKDRTFSVEIASHITIFGKVELSNKRISLLLEQEILRVNLEGFSLLDYFAFEWMLSYLIGNKDIHKVFGKKASTVVYCTYLILKFSLKNTCYLYDSEPLPEELSNFISETFGSSFDRKHQSRKDIYKLEKFLSFKIENVDVKFISRSSNSIPYTSYCKGYGEGGRSVRKQKTRFSYELDRDDSETIEEEEIPIQEIHYQEDLFYIEQILENKRKT